MTLEEEEDVQAELAALQRETEVNTSPLFRRRSRPPAVNTLTHQKAKEPSRPVQLPSVPVAEPVGPVEGEHYFIISALPLLYLSLRFDTSSLW